MKFNYNGSSSLATSIQQGAKADLFASANTQNMSTVTNDNRASGSPKVFAKSCGWPSMRPVSRCTRHDSS